MPTYHAFDCEDHDACVAIAAVEDSGVTSSVSHMTAEVSPELRANLDHPEIEDHREA